MSVALHPLTDPASNPVTNPVTAWQLLQRHGKSFAWAARLMARQDANLLARLYAVCRTIDDLADRGDGPPMRARLQALRDQPWHSSSDDPVARDLAGLVADTGLDPTPMHQLLDGVIGDLDSVAIRDEAELVRYGYRVAGTVGLMVCDVLRVRAPAARLAAIDLGIAMQLTNISRDVMEDAQAGRRYVPGTWLDATAEQIAAALPPTRAAGATVVLRLLDLADQHYRAAASGFRFLPGSSRLGVMVAARVYQGIGTQLRRRAGDYAQGRAYVPGWRKAFLTLMAFAALLVPRRPSRDLPAHTALGDLLAPDLLAWHVAHARH